MTRFTVAWICWLAAFVVIEWVAYVRAGYAGTATGHLLKIMQAHPIAAVVIPSIFVAIALHLLIDLARLEG